MSTEREIRLDRRIAADPTSLALLLAGPTVIDLWPGARRRGDQHGLVLVEADLPGLSPEPALVLVRAAAPRRTPASFVCAFSWGPGDNSPAVPAEALLTLGYEGAHDTQAELRITLGDVDDAWVAMVDDLATRFLDNLAAMGEARSRAA